MAYTLVPTELIVDGAITSAKLDTNIAISGTLGVTGEVTLATHLVMGDNDKIKIGTGGDLEIYHDGSNSYISNSTGNIYLGDTNGAVHIQAKLNEESIVASADGAVTLYHDNSAKLATASGGVTVTGTLTATTLAGTLSTAAQPNITSVGTLTGFTSTGIDDNADATAITIDSSENVTFAGGLVIPSTITHAGDTDTKLDFNQANTLRLITGDNTAWICSASSMVINEDSIDFDFRVESNGNANMLFVDGGNDRVGIGTASPATKFDVITGSTGGIKLDDESSSAGVQFTSYQGSTNTNVRNTTFNAQNFIVSTGAPSGTSTAERMRIDSSGNVGIGITNPGDFYTPDLVVSAAAERGITIAATATNVANYLMFSDGTSGDGRFIGHVGYDHATDNLFLRSGGLVSFKTGGGTERMRIDSSGRVSIGTTTTDRELKVQKAGDSAVIAVVSGTSNLAGMVMGDTSDDDRGAVLYNNSGDHMFFQVDGSERMRIDSSGKVGIGITNPDELLHIKSGDLKIEHDTHPKILLEDVGNSTSEIGVSGRGAGTDGIYIAGYNAIANNTADFVITGANGRINTRENLIVGGALSKASGSFRIDHPLESKKDTHHLVHSFVEAPQADNIYRGTVTLSSGTATVNLDTVAGMTEGTYVLLNTNSSCFTSNETDWDAVKGSVSGNTLTISCQNSSSTATVSWLVIGERHDQHMKDTDWTDSDGKVIVEPTK